MPSKEAVVAVIKKDKIPKRNPALKSLTLAALALPGLFVQGSFAADGDEVDFQYSHYRKVNGISAASRIIPMAVNR